jgi:hypothetical protein
MYYVIVMKYLSVDTNCINAKIMITKLNHESCQLSSQLFLYVSKVTCILPFYSNWYYCLISQFAHDY